MQPQLITRRPMSSHLPLGAKVDPITLTPSTPEGAEAKARCEADREIALLAQKRSRDAVDLLLTFYPEAMPALMAFRAIQRRFGYHGAAQDLSEIISEKTGPSTIHDPRR